jgi:serine/threonine protein kinase
VDKRSDIWSFGVLLFELLTGQRLFQLPGARGQDADARHLRIAIQRGLTEPEAPRARARAVWLPWAVAALLAIVAGFAFWSAHTAR